jgi:hypothetical protein
MDGLTMMVLSKTSEGTAVLRNFPLELFWNLKAKMDLLQASMHGNKQIV